MRLHGSLNSGILYDFSIYSDATENIFGQRTSDGWWIKSLVQDNEKQYYLLSRNDGYIVRNTFVSKNQIHKVLLEGTGISQLGADAGTSIGAQPSHPQLLDSAINTDTSTFGGSNGAISIVPKPPEEVKDKITPAAPSRGGWLSFGSKK